MLAPSMFAKLPPPYAAAAKTLNKKFTSDDIKKLDADLWKKLPMLRSREDHVRKKTTEYLRDVTKSLNIVEARRGKLVKCVTEIYGFEKIIAKQTKDFNKAAKSGDAKKATAIETKLRKSLNDYGKKMAEASKLSNEIAANLKDVEDGFALLNKLPATAPSMGPVVSGLTIIPAPTLF